VGFALYPECEWEFPFPRRHPDTDDVCATILITILPNYFSMAFPKDIPCLLLAAEIVFKFRHGLGPVLEKYSLGAFTAGVSKIV
jgi:hypothetical protein